MILIVLKFEYFIFIEGARQLYNLRPYIAVSLSFTFCIFHLPLPIYCVQKIYNYLIFAFQ